MGQVIHIWGSHRGPRVLMEYDLFSGTLEGMRERPSYKELIEDPMLRFSGACQEGCADLYVACQVYADGRPSALPMQTSYKPFTTRWNWNEWITLPVKYSDLPRDALLALTIWDVYGPRDAMPVGSTTISLFGKYGTFRQGMHDLKVWPNIPADGNIATTTPGKTSGKEDEMSRLAKLSKKHRNGRMPEVDWLDRLTFREIEMINERQKRDSNFMYLMIEFPLIHLDGTEYSVVYFEKGGDEVYQVMTVADMITFPDPEILQENLVESKHHKLARSLRSGPTDKDLKPNAPTRDQLNKIVEFPPTKTLTSEEKDLVWKFRFYLSSQKKALTKFLKAVNWTVSQEAKQALELLPKWSPMDIEDALELFSPVFSHPMLRKYAVTRLEQADDEELLLYLLQLVQALKYENFDDIQRAYEKVQEEAEAMTTNQDARLPPGESPLHGSTSGSLSVDSSPTGSTTANANELMRSAMAESASSASISELVLPKTGGVDLATFLITRACNNPTLANYFQWYLRVECDDQGVATRDPRVVSMYLTMLKRFSITLNNGGLECRQMRAIIARQQTFMDRVVQLVKVVARENANRKKKIEKLQALLDDPEALRYNFANFDSIPLPLDPEVRIRGILSEEASLYKSNLMPCRFVFKTTEDRVLYPTLFKHGDDLRQDQLVLQIITLMDKLLRKENLDLKLTPYKVLATSSKHGFVQLIESVAVAEILQTEGTLVNYYKKLAPSESTPQGISKEVIDNFIKSCAGYCVITYLLGVGDRHLDNLLMTKTGRLFHIDFGYMLGRDPKPMPPPMKLTKEMVDLMGGTNSDGFLDFKKLCYTAFLHLRRSANLILNLFSLMVDANIPDIALEPDKAVRKVQDKFCLDLSDEEAVHYMQSMIDVSVSATMAALMEQMHKIAQYWRK